MNEIGHDRLDLRLHDHAGRIDRINRDAWKFDERKPIRSLATRYRISQGLTALLAPASLRRRSGAGTVGPASD